MTAVTTEANDLPCCITVPICILLSFQKAGESETEHTVFHGGREGMRQHRRHLCLSTSQILRVRLGVGS